MWQNKLKEIIYILENSDINEIEINFWGRKFRVVKSPGINVVDENSKNNFSDFSEEMNKTELKVSPVDSSSSSIMYPIILGVFSGFFITVTAPNMKAILMNVNHPNIRGTAFALYNLADDLGRGFGPFIISFFILQFGRQWGFNLANAIWFICGIFILLMIKTYPKDQEGI